MQEAGIAGVDMNLWWVVAAPAVHPAADRRETQRLVHRNRQDGQKTREFLRKFGAEPFSTSPAETTKLIDKEIADWANYVKLAKIEAQ